MSFRISPQMPYHTIVGLGLRKTQRPISDRIVCAADVKMPPTTSILSVQDIKPQYRPPPSFPTPAAATNPSRPAQVALTALGTYGPAQPEPNLPSSLRSFDQILSAFQRMRSRTSSLGRMACSAAKARISTPLNWAAVVSQVGSQASVRMPA